MIKYDEIDESEYEDIYKEFYDNANVSIYLGTFRKGKRWNGFGKEYSEDAAKYDKNKQIIDESKKYLVFKGEYKEGSRWNGDVKEKIIYPDRIIFFLVRIKME